MRVPSVRFSPMIPMASRREANAVVPGFVRTEEGITPVVVSTQRTRQDLT